MDIKEFIEKLKTSPELREEFFYHPKRVAKKYGVVLTKAQLKKLAIARKLEKDPLLKATMCPVSSGHHIVLKISQTEQTNIPLKSAF